MSKMETPSTGTMPIHVGPDDLLATDPELWNHDLPLKLQREAMLNGAVAAGSFVAMIALFMVENVPMALAPLCLGLLTGYQWFRVWTRNVALEERRSQAILAVKRNMDVSEEIRRRQWVAVRDLVSCYGRISPSHKDDERLTELTREILDDLNELIDSGL